MNGIYSAGDTVFENWTIKKMIGEGAYGRVYEIERVDFKTVYRDALKVITIPQSKSDIDSAIGDGMDLPSVTSYFRSFVEEIVEEFELMAKLKATSNVVCYEDHRVIPHDDGIGWDVLIRMELLTSLLNYTNDHKLEEHHIIQMGIDMCSALELCQKHNIIHRDIKPENIFISNNGSFKLGDFGIARTADKTISGLSKKGTYTYMAPEVYRGQSYDMTVDLYSLGIVLYKYLNDGRVPFMPMSEKITYANKEEALTQRMRGEPIPAPKNGSEALKAIILKACAYNPQDRYASPMDMKKAFQALAGTMELNADMLLPIIKETSVLRGEQSAEGSDVTMPFISGPSQEDSNKTIIEPSFWRPPPVNPPQPPAAGGTHPQQPQPKMALTKKAMAMLAGISVALRALSSMSQRQTRRYAGSCAKKTCVWVQQWSCCPSGVKSAGCTTLATAGRIFLEKAGPTA